MILDERKQIIRNYNTHSKTRNSCRIHEHAKVWGTAPQLGNARPVYRHTMPPYRYSDVTVTGHAVWSNATTSPLLRSDLASPSRQQSLLNHSPVQAPEDTHQACSDTLHPRSPTFTSARPTSGTSCRPAQPTSGTS